MKTICIMGNELLHIKERGRRCDLCYLPRACMVALFFVSQLCIVACLYICISVHAQ